VITLLHIAYPRLGRLAAHRFDPSCARALAPSVCSAAGELPPPPVRSVYQLQSGVHACGHVAGDHDSGFDVSAKTGGADRDGVHAGNNGWK
jgi:hypothetical protein